MFADVVTRNHEMGLQVMVRDVSADLFRRGERPVGQAGHDVDHFGGGTAASEFFQDRASVSWKRHPDQSSSEGQRRYAHRLVLLSISRRHPGHRALGAWLQSALVGTRGFGSGCRECAFVDDLAGHVSEFAVEVLACG